MSEPKKPASLTDQLMLLKDRGCIIENEEISRETLTRISYYRLSAYFLPFRTKADTYIPGTSFEKILRIYEFDRKLRGILLSALEVVEISLRARLSQFHAEKYGPLGYLDPCNFNTHHRPDKLKECIDREIKRNRNISFVKHHIENYNNQFPIWVASELFTFGMLSYLYTDMKTADRKQIAVQYGIHYENMRSWLVCCTDLRNICAHFGRLYNRSFSAYPSGIDLSEDEKGRLWGAIVALKGVFPSVQLWNTEYLPSLYSLFNEYHNDIDRSLIAFPENWKMQLQK